MTAPKENSHRKLMLYGPKGVAHFFVYLAGFDELASYFLRRAGERRVQKYTANHAFWVKPKKTGLLESVNALTSYLRQTTSLS